MLSNIRSLFLSLSHIHSLTHSHTHTDGYGKLPLVLILLFVLGEYFLFLFLFFSLCIFPICEIFPFSHRFSCFAAHIFRDILRFSCNFFLRWSIWWSWHNWTVSQVGSPAENMALPCLQLNAASKRSGKLCLGCSTYSSGQPRSSPTSS